MLIKKGNKLKDIKTNKEYIIESIDKQSILHLKNFNGGFCIIFKCTIDFAERNFDLIC